VRRKDIRLACDDEKERIYEQIEALYLQEKPVTVLEHKSGFPAVTVDCEDIHILTDCLSIEQWRAKKKSQQGGEHERSTEGGTG